MRVRFGEVDRYGMLWHGHAASLFETARADLARRFDLGVSSLLDLNLTIPMVEMSCTYKKPAFEDEELVIQSSLLRPPNRTPVITFFYRVTKLRDREVVLHGWTRQLIMRQDGKILTRLPDALQTRLSEVWTYLASRPAWTPKQIDELVRGSWKGLAPEAPAQTECLSEPFGHDVMRDRS
jgi:acyl-CoA thioester hydrolase